MSYFALLDSDEENDKPVPKIAVKKETKTDSKDAKATAAAPAKTAAAPVKADGKPQAGKEQPKDAAKKDVKKPKDDKPKKETKEAPAADPVETGKDDPKGKSRGHGDRRHGAEKRGDKAPQVGPDGEPRVPRKREFDRRSSTGRSGEQRKDSRGPHSFGNVKQEAADAEKNPASAEPDLETTDAVPADPAVEEAAPEPELPKVVTYDEFLKKRTEAAANSENKAVVLETKSIRTVTADDFAGLKTKVEEETVFLQLGKMKVSKTAAKVAPAKNSPSLQLAFKVQSEEPVADYERPQRGNDRPQRGNAPAGRTGGNDRSPRVSTGPKSSVNVNDSEAFPSL